MTTKNEVSIVLRLLRTGSPGTHPEITQDTIDAWHETLNRFVAIVLTDAARRWIEREPRFPSLQEFLSIAQETARDMAAGEIGSGERATLRCPTCGDGSGFVEIAGVTATSTTTMRPCESCNTALYEAWRKGHMAPDHDCPECRDRRRGRTSKAPH